MTPKGPSKVEPAEIAAVIVAAFINYNNDFRKITRRSKRRFETRDWSRNQKDAVERIELYENSVRRTVTAVEDSMAGSVLKKSRPV